MYVWIWRFECSHNFFYFKEYGMTYCIISKCQEKEDQFERINFLFLHLLEKSLIPTNINIVFVVISHNSLVPLKWKAPKSENRSIINYAIFKMALRCLLVCTSPSCRGLQTFTKNHISFWSASKHSSLVITFLKSSWQACTNTVHIP